MNTATKGDSWRWSSAAAWTVAARTEAAMTHVKAIERMMIGGNGGGITDRRSAAGRAPDALSTDEDRDARPVRCNVGLSLSRAAAARHLPPCPRPRPIVPPSASGG